MPRLTPLEKRFLGAVIRSNIRLLFNRSKRNAGGGEQRFIPTRITVEPDEARRMIRLNSFIAQALNWMGKKLRAGSQERAHLRLRIIHLRDMNRNIRSKLLRPGRRGGLIVTGQDAILYFNTLELVHKAFPAIRMNYIQSARDLKAATEEAGDHWWDIRSIINVGHLPTQPRPEHFGR